MMKQSLLFELLIQRMNPIKVNSKENLECLSELRT